jgi:hypothetical protein
LPRRFRQRQIHGAARWRDPWLTSGGESGRLLCRRSFRPGPSRDLAVRALPQGPPGTPRRADAA